MASDITVREFDPATATPEQWIGFHALRRARLAEDDPSREVAADDVAERELRHADALWRRRTVLASIDDQPVGRLQLWWRREGSPEHELHAGYATAGGGVMQAFRRRGIATRLAHELLAFMRQERIAVTSFRVPNPAQGQAFLARIGARETYRYVDNRLALADARWGDLGRWSKQIPPGLHWEVHVDRVPMERLRSFAPDITTMLQDVPQGSSDHPRITFEADAYDEVYRRMDARGGKHLLVSLMAGDTLAAVCEATWFAHLPGDANQLFTGVARGWRRQGLGLAVKSRMLEVMRDHLPARATVLTNNAVDNAPMLRVNARLGFQRARESAVFQLRREDLEARLAPASDPSSS